MTVTSALCTELLGAIQECLHICFQRASELKQRVQFWVSLALFELLQVSYRQARLVRDFFLRGSDAERLASLANRKPQVPNNALRRSHANIVYKPCHTDHGLQTTVYRSP